ncbi:MAG: DUF983 domain-containing protein [Cytophagaceae bacterium]
MSRSTLFSILTLKCPRCHTGSLFVDPNPYHFSNISKMPDKCACCGQRLTLEPGFYYGAMYCSYGLSMLLFGVNVVLIYILLNIPAVPFLILNTIILLALWPFIFRLARALYIHIFVRFDPEAIEKFRQ